MRLRFLTLLMAMASTAWAQKSPQIYQIFNAQGKKTTFDKLLKDMPKYQVVLFGEYHDDAVIHFLQLKSAQYLAQNLNGQLALGAEMFEMHEAELLQAYLKNEIDEKTFRDSTKSLWINYKTDYRPIVLLAKEKGIPLVATNAPRYLARNVFRGGFEALDTLSDAEREWFPPLPIPYDIELPGYKNMLTMMPGHSSENLPKAQAIKDAVMAWQIIKNLPINGTLLHLNGSYHSNNYEGIVWYLNQYKPGLKILTIATVRQADVRKLSKESFGLADYIICVDEDMTKTH